MYKVAAIVHGGDIDVRKGFLNACINRIEHLSKFDDYDITAYYLCFERIEFTFNNIFLKKWKYNKRKLDNVEFNILWSIEYYSNNKYMNKILRFYNKKLKKGYWDKGWINSFADKFKDYDFLTVHSRECAYIAQRVKEKYGIPFYTTWHGSDIHSVPYEIPTEKRYVINALEAADYNFFVSGALLKQSDDLTKNAKKTIMYNGVDDIFVKYDDAKRQELRAYHNVQNCKVVSFAGTLRDIKNADIIPDIYKLVKEQYKDKLQFWIIGDGSSRKTIERKISEYGLNCKLWGNIPTYKMPELLNCTDLLILPSKNEGLPLIPLEALTCGANVVASKVGGIPESIGEDYCVDLGNDFVERFASKVVDVLENQPAQTFDNALFSWHSTAIKEDAIYKSVLNNFNK